MKYFQAIFIFGLILFVGHQAGAQATSTTAVEITAISMWDGATAPTLTNHCLNAVTAQPANTCGGAMTDVSWFRFTLPTQAGGANLATGSVRIQVVPTGFDAIVEFFAGTAAAPVFRQCINAGGSGATEVLRTNANAPDNNTISTNVEYYIRVSSVTDIASGCFTLGLQYYPGAHVRNGQWPVPNPDNGLPGYRFTDQIPRNISQNGTNLTFNGVVQATRFRFVNVNTPGDPGCTVDVTGVSSFITANQVPCICYGNSYQVYVQCRFEGHWAGESFMRTIQLEIEPIVTINTSSSGALTINTCRAVAVSGFVQAQALSSAAVYEWEWCTPGISCTYVTGVPGNTQCYLNTVPCLKFGRTYTVRVRVSVCGVTGSWSAPRCITIPSMPYAQVQSCPTTNVVNGTVLFANFIQGVNQYVWLFTPINPGAIMVPIGPAVVVTTGGLTPNAITIGTANIPNGTYRLQVKPRSTTCGIIQEGDYGVWCIITKGTGTQSMALLDETPPGFDSVVEHREVVYYDYVADRPLEFIQLTDRNGPELTFRVLTSGLSGTGDITLMTSAGQLVAKIPVQFADQDPHAVIRPPGLAPGLYIVRYDGTHGTGATKIFLE